MDHTVTTKDNLIIHRKRSRKPLKNYFQETSRRGKGSRRKGGTFCKATPEKANTKDRQVATTTPEPITEETTRRPDQIDHKMQSSGIAEINTFIPEDARQKAHTQNRDRRRQAWAEDENLLSDRGYIDQQA